MDILKRKVYVAVANNNYTVHNWQGVNEIIELTAQLHMVSLDRTELLLWSEEDFNIELNNVDESKWHTVGDVIKSVVQAGGR